MTKATTESDSLTQIRQTFCNWTQAVAECQRLELNGVIRKFWFDFDELTPSIFVLVKRSCDEFLERVRLER